jgi:molecular chaperone GrpE (heat shock protein)
MAMVPTDEHEPGVVMEEIRKLYIFKDKVLRVGQVVVATEKSE